VLARWLSCTPKTVYELAKLGIVVKASKGMYVLEASVTRYIEHQRRTAAQRGGERSLEALRSERIRIARETATGLELKNIPRQNAPRFHFVSQPSK
jgi:phage terminase Nu1 subunit (DNA packaging protein)